MDEGKIGTVALQCQYDRNTKDNKEKGGVEVY